MKSNEPRFQADLYDEHRPFYPPSLFKPLLRKDVAIDTFLDLACGAGQSLNSFINFTALHKKPVSNGYAVDPDGAMLHRAKLSYSGNPSPGQWPAVAFLTGSAESIPLPDASVGLVLVGSAFHWFERGAAIPEITRVLRPAGKLFIFEYQFPKCIEDPVLHETVRRRFNLEWKAPIQTPRGTLADLTEVFRHSSQWRLLSTERPVWKEQLSLAEFLGHIFSQSRYLHAEVKHPNAEDYRREIQTSLEPHFKNGPLHFDLKPSTLLFQKAAS